MKKIRFYIQRLYRLSVGYKKQEEILWGEMKKLHTNADWKHGIYEKDKYIEAPFEIADKKAEIFYYMLYDGYYHCRVKIVENFPSELTTDLFVLATHFNNLLSQGVVMVNVHGFYIEYHQKREFLIPVLYPNEIYNQLIQHYTTSKDIYAAFQRLLIEQEAPAIIIADLLRKNEQENQANNEEK